MISCDLMLVNTIRMFGIHQTFFFFVANNEQRSCIYYELTCEVGIMIPWMILDSGLIGEKGRIQPWLECYWPWQSVRLCISSGQSNRSSGQFERTQLRVYKLRNHVTTMMIYTGVS